MYTKKLLDITNNVSYTSDMQNWTPKEIEKFRKSHKLSRRAFGELSGVTGNCVYQWERGLRTPSATTKILLSRIEQDFKKEEVKKHGKRHL